MVGLHTDHGLVPKIQLVDDFWRYFCANWDSKSGVAKVILRKNGAKKHEVYEGQLNKVEQAIILFSFSYIPRSTLIKLDELHR